jgi:hypothetical protein
MTEHEIQRTFVAWCHKNEAAHPELQLLFAVPNGGARSPRTAAKLKLEGLRPGVPDMCLPVPSGNFAGLWLEFKTPVGRVSPEQKAYIALLEKCCQRVVIVRSAQEAAAAIMGYLNAE